MHRRTSKDQWTLAELDHVLALREGRDRGNKPRSLQATGEMLQISRQRVHQLLCRREALIKETES